MKALIAQLAVMLCIAAMVNCSPKPPPKVAKILTAVQTIKEDERRDTLFKRLGLWDDEEIKLLAGGTELGQTDEVWDLLGDGHWLLVIVSLTPPDEDEAKAAGGKVAGFDVYYREKPDGKIDWQRLERQLPYFEAGKVYIKQAEAEQGRVGQPATASESKPKGGEKSQFEAKSAPR